MIVYNTTYTVPNDDARNFAIWVHQSMSASQDIGHGHSLCRGTAHMHHPSFVFRGVLQISFYVHLWVPTYAWSLIAPSLHIPLFQSVTMTASLLHAKKEICCVIVQQSTWG